jgi:hypothetical protein
MSISFIGRIAQKSPVCLTGRGRFGADSREGQNKLTENCFCVYVRDSRRCFSSFAVKISQFSRNPLIRGAANETVPHFSGIH